MVVVARGIVVGVEVVIGLEGFTAATTLPSRTRNGWTELWKISVIGDGWRLKSDREKHSVKSDREKHSVKRK